MMRNKINWFWKCEFEDNNGNSIWKILSASTSLGAKKRAYEVSFNSNGELHPKYETITHASAKEVKEFKKMIKDRIKEK